LLQCDLDENGVAVVAFGEIARVNQVFVADGPNSVCHAYCRLHRDLVVGSAEESWSGRALIFSPIENQFFSKGRFLGHLRANEKSKWFLAGKVIA
jgi:hypothetical protein